MLGLRSRSRRRCAGSGSEDHGDEVEWRHQRPRTRSRSGSRTDQRQGPRDQSAQRLDLHTLVDNIMRAREHISRGNSGQGVGVREEEQVQAHGRGDDTAQDDSDVQIVEEEDRGVALSDSQEVNEVEEVAMGDNGQVGEEGDSEEERDSRVRVENGIGRMVERAAELQSTVRSLEASLQERDRVMSEVVGALTCPVCLELPRHLPVPVCQNGHTVCLTCSRNGLGHCPVCRDPEPRGVSLLAGRLIQVVPHRCPHQPCNKVMTMGEVEEHQAACQHRNIRCVASSQCHANLTPATLKEHLLGRCQYTLVVHPRLYPASRKACLKFTLRLQAACLNNQGRRQFSLRAFQWEGRCFCINIRKLVDSLLVLPMMVGSEVECQSYAVRATIGGGGRWDHSVSFTGGVVSTEVEKRRWDEDGFLVSLKSIRKLLVPGTPDEEHLRLPFIIELESRQE